MTKKTVLFIILLFLVFSAYHYFDIGHYMDLEMVKSKQAQLAAYYQANPAKTIAIYFSLYIIVTALSIPGAALMTLLGGALFGLWLGGLIVSFASTIGATLAFLAARSFFRTPIERRFRKQLKIINAGIEKEGYIYLLTLRLVPYFPFFLINILVGLTRFPVKNYFFISQLGMLPGTLVYVNAGKELAKIDSLKSIASPELILSLTLLGLFPLLANAIVKGVKNRKRYQRFAKPKHFDQHIVVIGAGAAGLVTAYIAAAVKAKVTLIEKHKMGGDCLNTGCVPSKALIHAANIAYQHKTSKSIGITLSTSVDFSQVMQHISEVIKQIEPHDSIARYESLGVNCIQGEAHILSPYQVKVNEQIIHCKHIVIASGARPLVPPIPGLSDISFYTSDNIWALRECPKILLVIGGGPIGCELAQAFSRLGSQVIQVEMADRLLIREDLEISEQLLSQFQKEGIDVRLNHRAKHFSKGKLLCDYQDSEVDIEFTDVLIALGRAPNVSGFGLENLDISLNPDKTIQVDAYLRTQYANIFACGDVVGPYQFTHVAAHQAWYCAVNALFKPLKFKVNYDVIPWTTFTSPEIARVGLNEQQAKAQDIAYHVTTYALDDLDRAIADNIAYGQIKVLTEPGKDRILGVTIVAEHASELLMEFVSAMKHGLGLNKILGTIHTYPTLGEANKYVAGVWKRAHAPEKLLQWLKYWHDK